MHAMRRPAERFYYTGYRVSERTCNSERKARSSHGAHVVNIKMHEVKAQHPVPVSAKTVARILRPNIGERSEPEHDNIRNDVIGRRRCGGSVDVIGRMTDGGEPSRRTSIKGDDERTRELIPRLILKA